MRLRGLEQGSILYVTPGYSSVIELNEPGQVLILRAHDALHNGRNVTLHLFVERQEVLLLLLRLLVALCKGAKVLLGDLWVHSPVVLVRIDPLGRREIVFAIVTILVVALTLFSV